MSTVFHSTVRFTLGMIAALIVFASTATTHAEDEPLRPFYDKVERGIEVFLEDDQTVKIEYPKDFAAEGDESSDSITLRESAIVVKVRSEEGRIVEPEVTLRGEKVPLRALAPKAHSGGWTLMYTLVGFCVVLGLLAVLRPVGREAV